MLAHDFIHITLALAYRWYWGWWWWWWVAIIFFFWWLFIPPFGYGRRWYTTRTSRYGSPRIDVAHAGEAYLNDWQAIEARFIESPVSALTQADHVVTELLQQRGASSYSRDYDKAHEIAARAGQNAATTDQMREAMMIYRSLYEQFV